MRKTLFTAFILLITGFSQASIAQVIPTAKLIPMIEIQVKNELKSQGYDDTDVSVVNIPMNTITLSDGDVKVNLLKTNQSLMGREYRRVDILVDGKRQRTLGVPIDIKIYKNILVAKESISKDDVLTQKNIEVKRKDILSLVPEAVLAENLSSGLMASRFYRAGDVIDKRYTRSKPDVVKNAIVTVLFKTDNEMSITVDGVALVDGSIGSYISVQNKTYNKVYIGKIIGTNKILVEI